jgi:hypothetical protein
VNWTADGTAIFLRPARHDEIRTRFLFEQMTFKFVTFLRRPRTGSLWKNAEWNQDAEVSPEAKARSAPTWREVWIELSADNSDWILLSVFHLSV